MARVLGDRAYVGEDVFVGLRELDLRDFKEVEGFPLF